MTMSNEDRLAEALLPCAFCKSDARYNDEEHSGYRVVCKGCGASGLWGDYGYQARDKWNRVAAHEASMVDVSDAEVEAALKAAREALPPGYRFNFRCSIMAMRAAILAARNAGGSG